MSDENDATEWVWVTHDASPGEKARVTRAAYDEAWKDLGWKLVDDDGQAGAVVEGNTVSAGAGLDWFTTSTEA